MNSFNGLRIREKRPFIIPKLSQKSKELLQKLDKNDKLEFEEIQKIISESFFNQDSQTKSIGYALTQIYLVHNSTTDVIFRNKRKEMKLENPLAVAERNLFFRVDREEDMKEIVMNSFKCVETEDDEKNLLGTSEMGIHFSKNLDILIRNEYRKRKTSFYCIITKALLDTKSMSVVPNIKNRNRDPDINHCYHVSMPLPNLENDVMKQFCDSLMYIYEYDENGEHLMKPRNLQPYAVLFYELEKPGQSFDRNILKKQSNTKSVLPNVYKPPEMTKAEKNKRRQLLMERLLREQQAMLRKKQIHEQNQQQAPSSVPFNNPPVHQPFNCPPVQYSPQQSSVVKPNSRDPRSFPRRPTLPSTSPSVQIQPWTTCITNEPPICRINSVMSVLTSENNINMPGNINLDDSVGLIYLSEDDEPEIFEKSSQPQTRSAACTFNPDFRPPTPPPKKSLYSDDDENDDDVDMLQLFEEWYGDLYRDGTLNENTPRWRRYYDQTGRFDIVFRGVTRLQTSVRDVRDIFKFSDEAKTIVNLTDPTNKLKLAYQEKRSDSILLRPNRVQSQSRRETSKTTVNPVNSIDVEEASKDTEPRPLNVVEAARNKTDEEYNEIVKRNKKLAKAHLKLEKQQKLAQAEQEARKSFVKIEKMDFD